MFWGGERETIDSFGTPTQTINTLFRKNRTADLHKKSINDINKITI